jgi:hypothetical protein
MPPLDHLNIEAKSASVHVTAWATKWQNSRWLVRPPARLPKMGSVYDMSKVLIGLF